MEDHSINIQSISTNADVEQLVELYKKLCTENAQLKEQLADALQKNSQLNDKIEISICHLEKLLSNLSVNKK